MRHFHLIPTGLRLAHPQGAHPHPIPEHLKELFHDSDFWFMMAMGSIVLLLAVLSAIFAPSIMPV